MALGFIPTSIGASFSVSLGLIPLTIFSLRRGWKAGIAAGFLWGLLHFPTGQVYYLSVIQVLIEYPIAFTFGGFAGLYATKLQKATLAGDYKKGYGYIVAGAFSGGLARYFWHFVAGVVFWGSYAMWGFSPFLYSLVMNGLSGLATIFVAIVVSVLIYQKMPELFIPKEIRRAYQLQNSK
ncbi:energy-coupled thiamine transporter ThiT [Enterococcus sp. AZ194]|uniref:energy-coupled thiamine transporter ThiT n=1 Tax=Enterococcus sp. AZ194 TaxID=2774629 RepID=UPI003F685E08